MRSIDIKNLPKGFKAESEHLAVNHDKQFGGSVFFQSGAFSSLGFDRGWTYLPNNNLVKGGAGFNTQEEAFKAFDKAVQKYKELSHWEMTQTEWNAIHKDYKGTFPNGGKSALRNINGTTVIVPVTIIK